MQIRWNLLQIQIVLLMAVRATRLIHALPFLLLGSQRRLGPATTQRHNDCKNRESKTPNINWIHNQRQVLGMWGRVAITSKQPVNP